MNSESGYNKFKWHLKATTNLRTSEIHCVIYIYTDVPQ